MTPIDEITKKMLLHLEVNEDRVCRGECAEDSFIPSEFHVSPCRHWKFRVFMEMRRMGIQSRFAQTILDGPVESKALLRVKEFLQKDFSCGRALVLASLPGRGKTLAGAFFVWQAKGLLVPARDLQGIFLNDDKFSRIKNCRALLVDDLAVEHKSDFFAYGLDALLDCRYGDQKATVISTNLNWEKFVEAYGQRIANRLKEWGSFCELKDRDFRAGSIGRQKEF